MAKNNQEEVNKPNIVRLLDFNLDDNDSEIDEMLNDLSEVSKTPEEEETPHVDWGALNFKKAIEVNLQPVNLEKFQKTTKIFRRYVLEKLNQNPPDPKDDHIREFFKGVKLKIDDDDDIQSKPATKSNELPKKEDQFILPSISNLEKICNEKVNAPQNSKSERNFDMKTSNVSNVTKTYEEKPHKSREYDQQKIDNQKFDINAWQKSIERNPSSKKSAETLQDFSSFEAKKTASLSDLEFPQPRSKYQSRAGMGRARLLGKPRENIEKTRSVELKPSIRTETDTQIPKSNTEDQNNNKISKDDIEPNKPDIEQAKFNEADQIESKTVETKLNKPDIEQTKFNESDQIETKIDQNEFNAEIKADEIKQEDTKIEENKTETKTDEAKPSDVNNTEVKPVNIETDKKSTADNKKKILMDLISVVEDGSELKQILLKELSELDGVKEKRESKPKSSQIAPQLRATMRSASSHQHPVQQSSSQTSQASNQTAWPMSPFYYVEEPNSSVNSTPIPAMTDTATTSSEMAHLAPQSSDSLHNATIPSAFKQFEKLSIDVNSHSGHQCHHSFPFAYDHDYYGANNEWRTLGQSLRPEQEQNRDVTKLVSNALGSSQEGGSQLQHQQRPQNQYKSIPQNHKPNPSMVLNYRPPYMVPIQTQPQQYYQYQQPQPYFMPNQYYYSYVPPPQSNFMSPPRAKSRQMQIYQQYYSPPPPPPQPNPPMMYNPYEASNVYSSSLPNSSLYTGYTAASFQPLNHPTTYDQESNQTPAYQHNYNPQPNA